MQKYPNRFRTTSEVPSNVYTLGATPHQSWFCALCRSLLKPIRIEKNYVGSLQTVRDFCNLEISKPKAEQAPKSPLQSLKGTDTSSGLFIPIQSISICSLSRQKILTFQFLIEEKILLNKMYRNIK